MEKVGVRELRQRASDVLRRVAAGETVEVTDRGRPVAVLLQALPAGLERLEQEGRLRRGRGDLLDLKPLRLPPDAEPPSAVVAASRDE
ncbi:MAG: type II toxin-antitoxin system Phd/YefM family antitoxin [Candidatus Limnocylindrales bacterium]